MFILPNLLFRQFDLFTAKKTDVRPIRGELFAGLNMHLKIWSITFDIPVWIQVGVLLSLTHTYLHRGVFITIQFLLVFVLDLVKQNLCTVIFVIMSTLKAAATDLCSMTFSFQPYEKHFLTIQTISCATATRWRRGAQTAIAQLFWKDYLGRQSH